MRLEILSNPTVEMLEKELDRVRKQFKNIDMPEIKDIEAFRKENLVPG